MIHELGVALSEAQVSAWEGGRGQGEAGRGEGGGREGEREGKREGGREGGSGRGGRGREREGEREGGRGKELARAMPLTTAVLVLRRRTKACRGSN
jgi:hypothetical protein